MASVKSYPSLAADVDPATAEVPLGGYVCRKEQVSFHEKLPVTELTVRNTGDRPIQVGSHFHFFEVNRALEFDRAAAFGQHLDIPASTALRFEPGDERRGVRGDDQQDGAVRNLRRARFAVRLLFGHLRAPRFICEPAAARA